MPPITLQQGSKLYNQQTGNFEGTVQFDRLTGQSLGAGQSTSLPNIDASLLQGNTQLPPLPPPPINNTAAFVAGTQIPGQVPGQIPGQQSQKPITLGATSVEGLVGQKAALTNKMLGLQQQYSGRFQDQLGMEQQAGIPTMNKDIAALSEQIASKKAAFDQAAQDITGKPIGIERQTGKIAQIQRNEAVQIGGLSALLMAKQGNLEGAKSEIDRTLTMKYEPIKEELQNAKDFLQLTYQDLDRADKIRSESLNRALTREMTAVKDFQNKQDMVLKKLLDSNAPQDVYEAAVKANNRGELAKVQANVVSQTTGVPTDIAEKIGESKVGQKVNANIDFTNSLVRYKNLYKQYADDGNLISLEAKKNLDALRNDLNQKYSVANGQGAVQQGDRDSYQKIIQGGYLFPDKAIQSMDTLLGSLNASATNDIKFLNSSYGGYATQFFAPQLETYNQSTDYKSGLTGVSLFDSVLAGLGSSPINISSIYNPNVGFILPTPLK